MAGNTTFNAPVNAALGRTNSGSGAPLNAAPSMFFAGMGVQDHRLPYNQFNSPTGVGLLGWYGSDNPMVANYVPSTIATANIAALANVVSGTAMTLRASTGAGITVLSSTVTASIWPGFLVNGQAALTSGRVIDGVPTYAAFGTGGTFTTAFYNRSTNVGRAVSISGVSGGAGGTFTVKGYDTYGYATSQLVTVAAGANTVNTTKTFKVVTSVTPNFTDAHNYSVGTADIFGFGILASYFGDCRIVWNSTVITANTGFVAADTTSPATTATGDVRGTYATQDASDGTKRLNIYVSPTLGAVLTNFTTGLFGQPQV